MEKLHWIHTLVFLGSICFCLCAKDPNFCQDPTPPAGLPTRGRPNVTNMFHTWVECVIINKNMTTDIHEYFDADHSRGFITQISSGLRYDALYSYDSNELISWYQDLNGGGIPGTCSVYDLSKTGDRFLFGYNKVNGMPHIFSANDALHLSGRNVNEVYMGVTSVRGIVVDKWSSCQYWTSMDATMKVDWYFSAKSTWASAIGIPIPVMAHVTGVTNNSTQAQRQFEHYYNFFHFKPFPDEVLSEKFETPDGLLCPGRRNTKKLPILAQDFSLKLETVAVDVNYTYVAEETFYSSQKMVRFEHHTTQYGSADIIEIHDFNTGVAYITDKHRGNCSAKPIKRFSFDVKSNGSDNVRIRTAKEFFDFDGVNVTYQGIKTIRNIDCDAWIGTRTDYPSDYPTNSTWEWFFAKNGWQEADPGSSPGAIPIQMRVHVPKLNWTLHFHIFNFRTGKPDLLTFDISACYNSSHKRPIQFQLPESSRKLVRENINVFKRFLVQSVVQKVGVSLLRVANIKASFSHPLTVTLELLDVAPHVARTAQSGHHREISLDFAATILKHAIQDGQFIIRLNDTAFQQMPEIIAIPIVKYTTTTHQPTTTTKYPSTQSQNTTGSIFCFSCDEAVRQSYCLDIKLCNQDEVCVVERFINHASNIRYRSGCKKTTDCSAPRHTASGFLTNANTDLCQHCCSTDFCNSAGCGDQGFPSKENRGPLCFSCDRVTAIGECDEVIPCRSDQVCNVKGYSWFGNKILKFHGCEDKLDCPNTNNVMGKRSVPVCHSCCTDDYCNRNCTMQAPGFSIIG